MSAANIEPRPGPIRDQFSLCLTPGRDVPLCHLMSLHSFRVTRSFVKGPVHANPSYVNFTLKLGRVPVYRVMGRAAYPIAVPPM